MNDSRYDRRRLFPYVLFVVLAAMLVTFWVHDEHRETATLHLKAELPAEQVAIRLEDYVDTRLRLIDQIRDFLADAPQVTERLFLDHASIVQRHFDGLVAINWVDADGVIRWVVPGEPNRAALGQDLTAHAVAGPVLRKAASTGKLQLTPPLELYQGGWGLAAYVPVERDGNIEGFVNVAFRLAPLIEACLARGVTENFFFSIADGDEIVYAHDVGDDGTNADLGATAMLMAADRPWRVTLTPKPELVATQNLHFNEILFGFSLLLALGLSWLVRRWIHSESDLASSRERYRQVVEDLPALICRFRPDTTLTFVNAAYASYFGKSPAQLVGTSFLDLIPADQHETVRRTLAELTPDTPQVTHEHEVIGSAGQLRWQEWRDRALCDPAGRITEYQSIGVDITERRQAREELRDSEERFRAIFGAVSDAIFIFDESGALLDVNERACELHGYPREELLRLDVEALSAPEADATRPVVRRWLRREAANGRPQLFEWKARHSSGRIWWGEVNLKQATIGSQTRILGVVRDVTGRKRLEVQLRHAQKMEAVGTLASGVAHDFNNILTAILGHNEMARALAADREELHGALRGIAEACDQAVGVTRSLLTFSRRTSLEKGPLELSRLVTDTIRMLHPILPDAIEVLGDVPSGADLWVDGNKTQLQQVLMNLAVNARDAMPDGGKLSISLRRSAAERGALGNVVLTVEDDGVGMPEEIRVRVVEPFFTTKPRERGTGLGMAVVHGIVAEHGGRLEIESDPGEGTRVSLRLPLCAAPVPVRDAGAGHRTGQVASGRVLLVEDHEQVRELIAHVLRDSGFEVIPAADGARAMELFEQHRESLRLIVLDVDLPRLSGPACLRKIRQAGCSTAAILTSGNPEFLLELGQFDNVNFLQKPFEMAELARVATEAALREHPVTP